ncbi:MAG TPA: SAM-dependent methyltransferase [Candidatus Lustribacter sp.]|nr:SAM-dependent methyltransferase [Candidatus Lustribacter sp.]
MIFLPWADAWQDALYGESGFYRGDGPGAHFTTATHGGFGAALADALVHLSRREGLTRIVDLGAGRGELLGHLHRADPTLALTGVDIVARPEGLPGPVEWLTTPGGQALPSGLRGLTGTLVVAHEWLDVVPCPVAEVDGSSTLRVVLVDPATGEETLGEALAGADLLWAHRFWAVPAARGRAGAGCRIEIGRPRDAVWDELLTRIDSGLALAVDYGHVAGSRPPEGTLTAYRHGCQVAPVPDGRCDITAHVAVDSLTHDELVQQRAALQDLGLTGHRPADELAHSDPAAYLAALTRASHEAALIARGGFGDFWWVMARRALPTGQAGARTRRS